MPFSSFSAAGIAAIQAGIVNTSGTPMGITGSITNGQGAALSVMKFAKRFGGQAPAPVRVTGIGDNNRSRHEYIFNAAQLGDMTFMFHALDLDAYAGFTGMKKYTDGNSYGVLLQSNAPANAAQACIVVNIDAQNADTGSFGLKRFANEFYSLVTVTPLLAQLQETAMAEWQYQGIPTEADKFPWGFSLNATTHGATRAAGELLTSDYPMTLETLVATTSQTTYTLSYTPATPTSTYVLAWKNGVLQTSGQVAVSGKTVTMTGATNGDILVFRYEATDLLALN